MLLNCAVETRGDEGFFLSGNYREEQGWRLVFSRGLVLNNSVIQKKPGKTLRPSPVIN
jgi:hypothetical protein